MIPAPRRPRNSSFFVAFVGQTLTKKRPGLRSLLEQRNKAMNSSLVTGELSLEGYRCFRWAEKPPSGRFPALLLYPKFKKKGSADFLRTP